jgi:hypothetical protein
MNTLQAGKDSVCYSELRNVKISDSVIVISSYDL